jgi:hypothetical protein
LLALSDCIAWALAKAYQAHTPGVDGQVLVDRKLGIRPQPKTERLSWILDEVLSQLKAVRPTRPAGAPSAPTQTPAPEVEPTAAVAPAQPVTYDTSGSP